MSQQWYCKVEGKEYGPIAGNVVQEWALDGRLSPTDSVRKEGGQWVAAKEIKGLNWPPVAEPVSSSPPPSLPWEQPDDSGSTIPTVMTSHYSKTKKLGKTPTSWLALFDWRFEYYLTPWIIRFLWIAFLLIIVVLFVLNTLGLIWGLLPDMSSAPAHSNWGRGMPEPTGPGLPDWLTVRFAKVVLYVVSVIGSIIGILVTRMMLELMIVVFRIAEDIGVLKRKYGEEGKG